MANDKSFETRLWLLLRYTLVAILCLLAALTVAVGAPWYLVGIISCGAVIVTLLPGRIFRPSVHRTVGEVICRYTPWSESSPYVTCAVVPLLGVCAIAGSRDTDNPLWLLAGGIFAIGIGMVALVNTARLWRLNLLYITPSALRMRIVARFSKPAVVLPNLLRKDIISIEPQMIPVSAHASALQAEITYRPNESNHQGSAQAVETILIGMHLTIPTDNLLRALITWYEATDDDPDRLLDRVEEVLRGQASTPA